MTDSALEPNATIDSDHPAIVDYARSRASSVRGIREQAVALYYGVRDDLRYDPYRLDLTPEGMRASRTLELGYGWCVTKASLLAAC
ncbi:MAG: transglutaminase family protein, partial [Myxococcota bacterium]